MAYFVNGNIFLQQSSNPPFQLTEEGKDRYPSFSYDGEKVLFLRGFIPHDLYSINSDGSQEQLLISGNKLSQLGLEYDELSEIRSFAFVPNTHQLIFNTRELGEQDVATQDWNRTSSMNKDDLLMVDADTGEIKSLLAPGKGGNFVISPDGNLVAIQAKGHIDIVTMDGQVLVKKLVTYIPTQPYELVPGIFWTDDSNELIVSLPIGSEYDMDGPETRSIWRYKIDGSAKFQVTLDPPVIGDDYSISPNGDWILYNYYYYPGKTKQSITSGMYLGNLHQGGSSLYSPGVSASTWSPDSLHFTFEGDDRGLYLGTPNGQPAHIDNDGRSSGWTDADHFLYFYAKSGMLMMGGIDGNIINIPHNIPAASIRNGPVAFSFVFLNP